MMLQTADGRMLKSRGPQILPRLQVTTGRESVVLSGDQRAISYEAIYEGHPACAAVVNKLAHQIATLPLNVFTRDADGDPKQDPTHPVAQLLNRPAPRTGQSRFKQWLSFSALIHGNGLVAKWRDPAGDGTPTQLIPLSWPYVSAFAAYGMPVEWWGTTQSGELRYLDVKESIHLAWHSSSVHGLGTSPLKQLAMTVRLEDAARRYQAASFDNAATPGVAVTPPAGFEYDEGERELLTAAIAAHQQGVDNAMKPWLLGPGFEVKPLSHSAREAELIAARTLNREEIAMVYDVPPPMIGDLTHGTYSNVEELHRMLYVTTLRPWFVLIEETINTQLIDPEPAWQDAWVKFDLGEVLRGNRREEIDAMSQAFINGLMTLNEVREALGFKRLDIAEADLPHIQANNMKAMGPGSTRILPDSP